MSGGVSEELLFHVAAGRARRRVAWGLAAFVAAFVLGSVAVSVVVAIAVADFVRSFDHLGARSHLKPIPVAASACPYVVAMHNAADDFQNTAPLLGFGLDLPGMTGGWPQSRPALRHAADVLDVTIAAGIPHVPAQVQTYLEEVRVDIQRGRAQAALAATPNEYLARVQPLVARGKIEFGYAGDLIGHACSVDLGADSTASSD